MTVFADDRKGVFDRGLNNVLNKPVPPMRVSTPRRSSPTKSADLGFRWLGTICSGTERFLTSSISRAR